MYEKGNLAEFSQIKKIAFQTCRNLLEILGSSVFSVFFVYLFNIKRVVILRIAFVILSLDIAR